MHIMVYYVMENTVSVSFSVPNDLFGHYLVLKGATKIIIKVHQPVALEIGSYK